MIILCSKSATSAKSVAEHLRNCTTRGPFVIYFSSDVRAARLAATLAEETAIEVNALLRWGCSLCLSVACLPYFTAAVRDKVAIAKTPPVLERISPSAYYSGVALGLCLIAVDGYKDGKETKKH